MDNCETIIGAIKMTGPIVNVSKLANWLNLELQSSKDLLQDVVSQENIVKIPTGKSKIDYYLTQQGVKEFLDKYKPDKTEEVLKLLSDIENKELKKADNAELQRDPYSVDLLEDILATIKHVEARNQYFQDIFLEAMSKTMCINIEIQTMLTRGFSILMKAEAEGYLARTNRKRAHDLNIFSKEFSNSFEYYTHMFEELQKFLLTEEPQQEKESLKDITGLISKIVNRKEGQKS